MCGNPECCVRFLFTEHCSLAAYIPGQHADQNFTVVLYLLIEYLTGDCEEGTNKSTSVLGYKKSKPVVDKGIHCEKKEKLMDHMESKPNAGHCGSQFLGDCSSQSNS